MPKHILVISTSQEKAATQRLLQTNLSEEQRSQETR